MTEQEATAQGLHFTGIYNRFKEDTKERIAKERIARPKARIVLVRVPDSKLSRGYSAGACGWSAYADEKWSAYERLADLGDVEAKHAARLKKIQDDYATYLQAEENRYKTEQAEKIEAENILNSCKLASVRYW